MILSNLQMSKNDRNEKKRYLLITSCSKSKKKRYGVKAINLYDGPSFKIIRKHMSDMIDILILSAKYGLIKKDDLIDYYDEKMNKMKAKYMSSKIKQDLKNILESNNYEEILINLGKVYRIALKESNDLLDHYNVVYLEGPIGVRLQHLKKWLILKGGEVNAK